MRKTFIALLLALGMTLGSTGVANAAPAPDPVPTVSAGAYDMDYWWLGPYVDLDKNDQGAVAAGVAAGVAATICIVTNGWACPVASAIVASAAFYIAINGVCPNKLRIYPNYLFGYPMRCVS
jgi:hypothetical protein